MFCPACIIWELGEILLYPLLNTSKNPAVSFAP